MGYHCFVGGCVDGAVMAVPDERRFWNAPKNEKTYDSYKRTRIVTVYDEAFDVFVLEGPEGKAALEDALREWNK